MTRERLELIDGICLAHIGWYDVKLGSARPFTELPYFSSFPAWYEWETPSGIRYQAREEAIIALRFKRD